jgi:tetratricopeptide (TPR) repeat protein
VSEDVRFCFYLGLDLFNHGYTDAAIIFYEQVVKLEAFDLETYFNKAFSLSVLERHTEALYFYDLVIKLNPTNAEAYVHKGVALSNLGYEL